MRAHGPDRVRFSGDRIILYARLAKGWTPRTGKTLTHAEFPGTTVLWDDEYYEVIEAVPSEGGGVRYALTPWRDDHTIRQFEPYDEESEARLSADHEKAARQRKHSLAARIGAMLLGHLPAHVQMRLADDLGLFPARMTLWSIPPVILAAGVCIYISISAFMSGQPSPIPDGVLLLLVFMLAESVFRYLVAMTQSRAMGSILGTLVYLFIWLLHPNRTRLVSPFAWAKGEGLMSLPPSPDVERRDSLEMRAVWLTLLSPVEQRDLAERYGYDYREHAYGLTWVMLVCAAIGFASMVPKAPTSFSAMTSMVCAGLVVLEQVVRLIAFRRGPAGSVFGVLVRPFVRDLLRGA